MSESETESKLLFENYSRLYYLRIYGIFCDFIDGFIRTECNPQVHLFPDTAKKLIESYYFHDTNTINTTDHKLSLYIEYKQKQLQLGKQKHASEKAFAQKKVKFSKSLKEEIQNHCIVYIFFLCLFIPSLTAMIIGIFAFSNNNSFCYDNNSVVDPIIFTLIAGLTSSLFYLSILFRPAHVLLIICVTNHCIKSVTQIDKIKQCLSYKCSQQGARLMLLFEIVWCIVGFYIYNGQMSDECKHSLVGEMLIAWSIIIFIGNCFAIQEPIWRILT